MPEIQQMVMTDLTPASDFVEPVLCQACRTWYAVLRRYVIATYQCGDVRGDHSITIQARGISLGF